MTEGARPYGQSKYRCPLCRRKLGKKQRIHMCWPFLNPYHEKYNKKDDRFRRWREVARAKKAVEQMQPAGKES